MIVSARSETEAKCVWRTATWWTGTIPAIPSRIVPPSTNSTDVFGTGVSNAFLANVTDTLSVTRDRTLREVYESTQNKQETLRQRGYDTRIIWECEWDSDVKTNVELRQFLDTLELVEPLRPRNAFFGGRTNAVKLHHMAERRLGEKIEYIDVTSLYPWVNKRCEYPTGHPDVLVNPDDQDIHHYFGMA